MSLDIIINSTVLQKAITISPLGYCSGFYIVFIMWLQLQHAQADEDHLHKHTAKLQKAEMEKFKKDLTKEKKQRSDDMKKVGAIKRDQNWR